MWEAGQVSWILQYCGYAQNSASVYNYFKKNTKHRIYNDIEEFDGTKSIMLFRQVEQFLDGTRKERKEEEQLIIVANHNYIIDAETWIKVQNKISRNTLKSPRIGRGKTSILSGLVYCGNCHNIMTISGGKKIVENEQHSYKYFKCKGKHSKGTDFCSIKNVKVNVLEEVVEKALYEYINNDKLISNIHSLQEGNLQNLDTFTKELNDYKNQIDVIEVKISNLINSFLDGNIKEFVEKEVSKLALEKSNIEKIIQDIQFKLNDSTNNKYSIDILKEQISSFEKIYKTATHEEKQFLIKGIIKNIEVFDKYIKINFYDHTTLINDIDSLFTDSKKALFPHKVTSPLFSRFGSIFLRLDNQNAKVITITISLNNFKESKKMHSVNTETFGGKIRKYRLDRRLYAKDIAKIIGCSYQTVLEWEKNISKPNEKNLIKLKNLLNREID